MMKKFIITDEYGTIPINSSDIIILILDNWNDFSYYTLFGINYIDSNGNVSEIGSVRIAYFGQQKGRKERKLVKGDTFDHLENNYFSLGTDDSYYDNLNNVSADIKKLILKGLNDIAFNQDLLKKAIDEDVTQTALLRNISFDTVMNQYSRIAQGGARLTDYQFSYSFSQKEILIKPEKIYFNVFADKKPSTNIHAIIGRNGVGKSYLLDEMINSILNPSNKKEDIGNFTLNEYSDKENFTNIVSVTFSAFDNYQFENKETKPNIKYQYIGLKNNPNNFEKTFTTSLNQIISESKIERWKNIVSYLESDPVFENEHFIDLIELYDKKIITKKMIEFRFSKLSSGHKIILLTITKLVELLQEKSLVFFDEPETHLHPPLLSSFIRAFSELLSDRNAVCIMTTHSPIIIQEIPKNCVYKLNRIGNNAVFERPKLETFGENVGVLTNEIFGLEAINSGFYNVLKDLVKNYDNYNQAIDSIDNKLGIEGKSILRSLFFNKNKSNETLV